MNNSLRLSAYEKRDSRKDLIVYTDTDILDGDVMIKVLHDGLQFTRAKMTDRKTHKLGKYFYQYRTTLCLVDLEAGDYEYVEEESDTDTLTFRLPE